MDWKLNDVIHGWNGIGAIVELGNIDHIMSCITQQHMICVMKMVFWYYGVLQEFENSLCKEYIILFALCTQTDTFMLDEKMSWMLYIGLQLISCIKVYLSNTTKELEWLSDQTQKHTKVKMAFL